MARSICSLDAVSRWAVTGTPIQNKLADLSTLLKFLHVHPYSEKKVFEADISNIWKSDGSEEAVRRLQRLAGCLILRRPKSTIDLPDRRDLQVVVTLAPPERHLYDEIRMQTRAQIEAAIQMHETLGTMVNYTNMFQRIEALRMVCNLGLYYHSRKQILDLHQPQADMHAVSWEQIAQKTFDMRREMDAMHCRICTYPIDAIDMNTELLGTGRPLFFRCWEFFCSLCSGSALRSKECCSHTPSCPVAVVTTEVEGLDERNINTSSLSQDTATSIALPTKLSLLVQDLRAQADTKW